MRISDWSSDVCSSDLGGRAGRRRLDTAYRCRECGEPGVGLLLRRCQRVTDRALPVVLLAECQQLGVGVRMGKRRPGQQDGGSGAKYGSPVHVPLPQIGRSEEHTSELQSLMRISYAVFCLKKKNKHKEIKDQMISRTTRSTNNK